MDIEGTVELRNKFLGSPNLVFVDSSGLRCRGTGTYADLHNGTPIVISSNIGEVLGTGELERAGYHAQIR